LDDRSACKDNITNLSRSRWLVVMARDSNVVIKGLVLDVRRTEQAPVPMPVKALL
jgi:TolB-like protein